MWVARAKIFIGTGLRTKVAKHPPNILSWCKLRFYAVQSPVKFRNNHLTCSVSTKFQFPSLCSSSFDNWAGCSGLVPSDSGSNSKAMSRGQLIFSKRYWSYFRNTVQKVVSECLPKSFEMYNKCFHICSIAWWLWIVCDASLQCVEARIEICQRVEQEQGGTQATGKAMWCVW